ncbi:MAG: hypothetical protein V4510_04090 [bacterium]
MVFVRRNALLLASLASLLVLVPATSACFAITPQLPPPPAVDPCLLPPLEVTPVALPEDAPLVRPFEGSDMAFAAPVEPADMRDQPRETSVALDPQEIVAIDDSAHSLISVLCLPSDAPAEATRPVELPMDTVPFAAPAEPNHPALVALPDAVQLTYVVDQPTIVDIQGTVTPIVGDLPLAVPALPDASVYLQVETATGTVQGLNHVEIQIPVAPDALPAPGETLTLAYYNGVQWVDLSDAVDGRIAGATPAQDLTVEGVGYDDATQTVWAHVSHTSTYAVHAVKAPAPAAPTQVAAAGMSPMAIAPIAMAATIALGAIAILAINAREVRRMTKK